MKIHQILFYFLILLLPTQLGKHFWPDWSLVQGLRIDYLSPTIYLTDIIILGILGSWAIDSIMPRHSGLSRMMKAQVFILLIGSLVINSLLAASPAVAFYKLIKIIEFSLLGFYIVRNNLHLSFIIYLLSFSTIYSSLLAITQFFNQGSLGGLLWFLGERTFNAGTPGIAQIVINGQLILRPYATFPHPNVLGGFLAVSLVFLLLDSRNLGRLIPGILWMLTFVLGTTALFLSFSRSAWFVFGLSLMAYGLWFAWVKRKIILRHWPMLVLLIVVGGFLFSLAFPRLRAFTEIQPESLTLRQDLNIAALKMINQSPVFGVGLGNFLVRLPEFYQEIGQVRFLQPSHNIYLMIGAETGLIGLGLFLWFIILTYRKLLHCSIAPLLISLGAILILGFFDHYFYTLQQGQLLLTLVLGLAWQSQPGVKQE